MKTVLYKGNRYNYNPYRDMDYQRVCFSIEDIKRVLGLDFSMYKKDGVVKKLSQEEINNYTKNDNATGSFDEFIDELNTELNQESYTELEQQNKTQANRIAELEQQLEELKQKLTQATQPPITDEDINKPTYNPDVLLKFIKEIINPELLEEDGKLPTYSRLYTKLSHKYPKKRVTTKNTIKKYLSQ